MSKEIPEKAKKPPMEGRIAFPVEKVKTTEESTTNYVSKAEEKPKYHSNENSI